MMCFYSFYKDTQTVLSYTHHLSILHSTQKPKFTWEGVSIATVIAAIAMDTSKLSALLIISMLFTSSVTACNTCPKPHPRGPGVKPPGSLPIPPVKPPVKLPPVTLPPVPVVGGGSPPKGSKPCPSPPSSKSPKCPIDTLKLGGCVDLLNGLVHIGLGDPAVNQCCPVLQGLVDLEAAACLCTTLKVKLLNLNLYVPLALELLLGCGKTLPPGYTCSV